HRVCLAGKDTGVPDDMDIPASPTDCDDELCTSGVPSNPLHPVGCMCNTSGGAVCNAAGKCVQCNVDADCPGIIDDCQRPICVAEACQIQFTPVDTPINLQVPGDCKLVVC